MKARLGFLCAVAVLLGAVVGLSDLTAPDPELRNREIFTEMAYGVAYESWSPNPNFADGKTVQPLVAGVVPRGGLPFPYGEGPEEAQRAGRELRNPVPRDAESVGTLGAGMYRAFCLTCHDATGGGNGPVVLRGVLPPPSLHADRARTMADGEMFHVLTRGQGNMASYAAELSELERWLVVNWVRRLQEEEP